MHRISDPIGESAYEFSFNLISSQTRLDSSLELLIRDSLLTPEEITHLERPNSTYRQRFIIVRNALGRNPGLTSKNGFIEMPWLRVIEEFLHIENQLKDGLQNSQIIQQVLEIKEVDIGTIVGIEKIDKSGGINFPCRIVTTTGEYFLRYTPGLGSVYFLRFDPKETIFRHILGEKTFALLIGPHSTTETISPTLEQALSNFSSREADTIEERLAQRVIIQPYYSHEYFRIQDYKEVNRDLQWMISAFAKINAMVHSSTAGVNSALGYDTERTFSEEQTAFVASNKEFYRYVSPETYEQWLREVNWITKIVLSFDRGKAKIFPQTDLSIIDSYERARTSLKAEGVDVEDSWWQFVESAADFWKKGAVLTGSDIKPSNSFYRERDAHIRLFDFDYFGFFDAPYHLGQGIYTVLRFATARENVYEPKELSGYADLFVREFHKHLQTEFSRQGVRTPEYYLSGEFERMAYVVGALSFFYVMMHDYNEKQLTPAQINSVIGLTRGLLKRND